MFQSGVADSIFGGNNAGAGFTFSFLIALMCVGSVGNFDVQFHRSLVLGCDVG